jgi:hypothetical protein
MALPRRVLVMMLVMVALTTAPYVVALAAAPKGTTFRGTILDIVDYNSHLAKMQQGLRGEWLYRVLFTTEPHEAALLQTFYIALGHVARWTGLSADVTYHLARIIFTALMVWALWAFLRHYLDENAAWWALLLCLFAGGVGYLIYALDPAQAAQISPIEFWLLDGYVFLASFTFPHFAAGIALLCLAFLMLDRWTALGTPGSFAVFFLAALALGLVQPFDLPLIDILALLVVGWRVASRRMPAIER